MIGWSCCRYNHIIRLSKEVFTIIATGDGEKLMKFCPSFHVVQLMKQGHSPQYACEYVLKDISKEIQHHFEAGLIALDHKVYKCCLEIALLC